MTTRIERFRAYMERMNPVADPRQSLRDGLYVEPPGRSVAEEVALRLELEPASSHLVLGNIGSGKTSEMLRARDLLRARLSEVGDRVAHFDVSQLHDLDAEHISGALVAIAGAALVRNVGQAGEPDPDSALGKAVAALNNHAHGYWTDDPPAYFFDDHPWHYPEPPAAFHVPGALVPPEKPLPDRLKDLVPHLRTLRTRLTGDAAHTICLFDSLDRLPSPNRFREAVEHDLRVLKRAGIGAVVVGPSRFIAGNDRSIADLFDHTHFQLPADPEQPNGLVFLKTVLRRRSDPGTLPDTCLEPLARASGGVMRDLIQLAKLAANEAYAFGHEPISPEMVARAIDIFGRNLAVGLDDEQVKKLKHLQSGGGFVIRGERELSLIETRRVLFYGEARWKVHPALAPLLAAIPEAA